MDFLCSVLLSFLGLFFPLIFFDPDFVGLLAHFIVAICCLDQLEHDVVVHPSASMVASRVDGREDTAAVTFLGMPREFGVVGLDHESSFRDEIHGMHRAYLQSPLRLIACLRSRNPLRCCGSH